MLHVVKITPFDRHFRTFVNPFIDSAEMTKAKKQTKSKSKKTPNKQTIKPPHQIELDRYKAQPVEGYEPLFKVLHKQYPIERRY